MTAAVVAVWPRTGERAGGSDPRSRPPADLAAARASAALRPCPAHATSGRGPASLVGVTAECVGDGSRVELAAALAFRPVLINVWASWCQPCREELPALESYSIAPGAVTVLGVQVQSDAADGLDLLAALGVHFPSVLDADGAVARALVMP